MIAEELSGNDDYVELAFNARKLDDKVKCLASALLKEVIKLAHKVNKISPHSYFFPFNSLLNRSMISESMESKTSSQLRGS